MTGSIITALIIVGVLLLVIIAAVIVASNYDEAEVIPCVPQEIKKDEPTHWTLGWSGRLELGFDDGRYLPREAAIILYPQYFDEKGEPIKSALPFGRNDDK